jgi:membrane protein DedA with SNARE-associated domain
MYEMLIAIWQQDFEQLIAMGAVPLLIFCLALILFLESSFVFLPLPGDSLVLFAGGLVATGVVGYEVILVYLPLAAALGTIIAYWQGYGLAHTRFMHHIEKIVPPKSFDRAHKLLEDHGFMAMFSSRFVPFVRVLTPMLMGMTNMNATKVAIISFLSAFCWCVTLSIFSATLMQIPWLEQYHHLLAKGLIMLSAVLFVLAVIAVIYRWCTHGRRNRDMTITTQNSAAPLNSTSSIKHTAQQTTHEKTPE